MPGDELRNVVTTPGIKYVPGILLPETFIDIRCRGKLTHCHFSSSQGRNHFWGMQQHSSTGFGQGCSTSGSVQQSYTSTAFQYGNVLASGGLDNRGIIRAFGKTSRFSNRHQYLKLFYIHIPPYRYNR
jgi:hypothetical protein